MVKRIEVSNSLPTRTRTRDRDRDREIVGRFCETPFTARRLTQTPYNAENRIDHEQEHEHDYEDGVRIGVVCN
jgi:hypothetical protein